jgi:VanZ family protein
LKPRLLRGFLFLPNSEMTLINKKYLLASLVWLITIFVLCTMRSSNTPKIHLFPHADKVVHAGIYFVLSFLLMRAFQRSHKWLILIFCIAYGLFIEWYQGTHTQDRSMDVWDAVANSVGALIGIVL